MGLNKFGKVVGKVGHDCDDLGSDVQGSVKTINDLCRMCPIWDRNFTTLDQAWVGWDKIRLIVDRILNILKRIVMICSSLGEFG